MHLPHTHTELGRRVRREEVGLKGVNSVGKGKQRGIKRGRKCCGGRGGARGEEGGRGMMKRQLGRRKDERKEDLIIKEPPKADELV